MKFRPLIFKKLSELEKETIDLSFGDFLYSFLRKLALKESKGGMNWLREIPDKSYYTAVEQALELELEYKEDENRKSN